MSANKTPKSYLRIAVTTHVNYYTCSQCTERWTSTKQARHGADRCPACGKWEFAAMCGEVTQIEREMYHVRPPIDASPRTTEYYWDCECVDNYIHPKSEHNCLACGVFAEDMPDSHATEASTMLSIAGALNAHTPSK